MREVIIGILLLFGLIVIGMPIAFCLGVSGIIGLFLEQGVEPTLGILATAPFRSVASYTLVTIPLFVLMAELLDATGLARLAYIAAYQWIGHYRGGLAMATMFGGAVFGAVSGSSSASTATFGAIAIPEMRKYKYADGFSAGTVALAGTLAAVIPPSILLVVYGSQTDTSIGKVLMAGVIPGIVQTLLYIVAIWIYVRKYPDQAPKIQPFPWKERWASALKIWPLVIIGISVLGAIYTGVTTPTEAAALGAVATFVVGCATNTLSVSKVKKAFNNTLKSTVMIFTIVIGATVFTYFMTFTGISQDTINWIGSMQLAPLTVLIMVILLYVVLGMFLPAMGSMLLTLPLVAPLLFSLGYDPIWFGVLLVMLLEIGLVTPPVGLNCFIVSGISGIPLEKVFKGSFFLLIFAFVGIALMVMFPQMALWLPSLMK